MSRHVYSFGLNKALHLEGEAGSSEIHKIHPGFVALFRQGEEQKCFLVDI